jgi:hypothetical protein
LLFDQYAPFAILKPKNRKTENLKKTMMGAARRQQHVFRRLGNQICDSPPHHTQSHRAKTA